MNLLRSKTLLLVLSLATNLLLCIALLTSFSTTVTNLQSSAASITSSTSQSRAPASGSLGANKSSLWTGLSSPDLAALMKNLHAAGFSPEVTRKIIRELVQDKYMPRLLAFDPDKETPYWQSSSVYFVGSRREQEHRKIEQAMAEELHALLGTDALAPDDDANLAFFQCIYGELPAYKIGKLRSLENAYAEKRRAVNSDSTSANSTRGDRITTLEQQMRRDMETLLTKEELYEYDLRSSSTARQLRQTSHLLALDEKAYRRLFPIQQTIESEIPPIATSDYEATARARIAAAQKHESEIKAVLGEIGFYDFLQAQRTDAIAENCLVRRLELPLSAAAQLVDAKRLFADRSQSIRSNKQLTSEQMFSLLAENTTAANQYVSSVLGDRGLHAYNEHGGDWLQSIAQP